MGASVDVRLEFHPLFADFASVFEAVYLKSAAVGEHGAGPGAECVQAAGLFENVGSGAQVEVVGIAQNDVRSGIGSEQVGANPFDGALGSYGHEYGGRNRPVGGVKQSAPRRRMGVFCLDFKLHGTKVRRGFLDYFCPHNGSLVHRSMSMAAHAHGVGIYAVVWTGVARGVVRRGLRFAWLVGPKAQGV